MSCTDLFSLSSNWLIMSCPDVSWLHCLTPFTCQWSPWFLDILASALSSEHLTWSGRAYLKWPARLHSFALHLSTAIPLHQSFTLVSEQTTAWVVCCATTPLFCLKAVTKTLTSLSWRSSDNSTMTVIFSAFCMSSDRTAARPTLLKSWSNSSNSVS